MKIQKMFFSFVGIMLALGVVVGCSDITNAPDTNGTGVETTVDSGTDAGTAMTPDAKTDVGIDTNTADVVDAGSPDVVTDAVAEATVETDSGTCPNLANVVCATIGESKCGYVCTCKLLWAPTSVASYVTCDDGGADAGVDSGTDSGSTTVDSGTDVANDTNTADVVDAGSPDVATDAVAEASTDSGSDSMADAQADVGTDSGSATGVLELTAIVPSKIVPTYLRVFVDEQSTRTGRSTFYGSPANEFLNTDRAIVTVNVQKGARVKVNGAWNPADTSNVNSAGYWTNSFCNAIAGQTGRRVAFWGYIDGSPIAPPEVVSNGQGGCDLFVTATPATTTTTDQDGDGIDAPTDCDDHDPAKYPGQIESWNDSFDLNCDGSADPKQYKIIGIFPYPLGFGLTVHALGSLYPSLIGMGCRVRDVGMFTGVYDCESDWLEAKDLPSEFYVDNSSSGASQWYELDYNSSTGACSTTAELFQVTESINGTVVGGDAQPVGGTCHRFVDPSMIQ